MKISLKAALVVGAAALVSIACVAETEPGDDLDDSKSFRVGEFCGGIAGFACPEGLVCVDDPTDDCDPDNGGADCGGVCRPQGGKPECDQKPEECPDVCQLDGQCPAQCHCPGGGDPCGDDICNPQEICCAGQPFPEPTCFGGDLCPISRREYKTDIHYLAPEELRTLHGELLQHKVASYRYKDESLASGPQLGFIIDDVVPSPSVQPSGERVNMYGYTTMAVAALQVQAEQIERLERKIADLEARLGAGSCE